MAAAARLKVKLAWFVGMVVSVGAVVGIVSTPPATYTSPHLPLFVASAQMNTLFWLVSFVLLGWLGWRIHTLHARGAAFALWFALLVLMLVWRPMLFLTDASWPGVILLAIAAVVSVFLMPLVAALCVSSVWACLPIVLWLGYKTTVAVSFAAYG